MTKRDFSMIAMALLLVGAFGACATDEDVQEARGDHGSVDISEIPQGAAVLTLDDDAPDGEVAAGSRGNCDAWYEPCGVVHNRSGGTLQLSHNSSSHPTCQPTGEYRDLPNGRDSTMFWRDTDCVRSNYAWIVTNGRAYRPGDWIRVWTHKWIY